jgi:hypothetical protein
VGDSRVVDGELGTFIRAGEDKPRPWTEAVVQGPVGQRVAKGHDLEPAIQSLVDTAPPIVKTSGLAKAVKATAMLQAHIDSWTAMMGRPMVVGDLSEQMRVILHLQRFKQDVEITPGLIERAAKINLTKAENEMRAAENRKVVKEPYYVSPGVR